MTPHINVIPHPQIKGAWTLKDPYAKLGEHVPMFASKEGAEMAARRNYIKEASK